MTSVPNVTLTAGNSTIDIPQLGFGVWQVSDDEATTAVTTALEVGYRSIDTARIYENEDGVGRALASTDVSRDEIFLTTKVWNDDQGYDSTLRAFEASAKRLGQDYVDLYLIHWPTPAKDAYVDTWKALLQLRADGRIRAAGVCNFQPAHLQRLIDETGEAPAINQVELHPRLQQAELRAFHARHGIVTEAWSPLAQGGDLLKDDTITGIARKHARTPAQVILRWHLQVGNVVIPKSVTPSRISENFDVFGFDLDAEDLAAIAGLDRAGRIGPDPDEFNVGA
ncbi:aldo/keto reductase [Oryzihumus leptocrescens]|uniref:Diketogulonate reductase-like aldo/keto reductase n=1 Tax=Oryzihumus leptocrescens TaxID=297536 RepID=A0A542ZG24_9MICO|nr:aldo/keto reductase [Oryzihumus leptocrescens]TQL59293.1 diketogulonate reductase-like aldo/keto reductase [Oryzihumus leptocrescens]